MPTRFAPAGASRGGSAHSRVTNSSFRPDSRSTATLAASLCRSPPAQVRLDPPLRRIHASHGSAERALMPRWTAYSSAHGGENVGHRQSVGDVGLGEEEEDLKPLGRHDLPSRGDPQGAAVGRAQSKYALLRPRTSCGCWSGARMPTMPDRLPAASGHPFGGPTSRCRPLVPHPDGGPMRRGQDVVHWSRSVPTTPGRSTSREAVRQRAAPRRPICLRIAVLPAKDAG